MKLKTILTILVFSCAFFSCSNNNNQKETSKDFVNEMSKEQITKSKGLSSIYLGMYRGIQSSYNDTDNNSLPGLSVTDEISSRDFKFFLRENNELVLQQKYIDDDDLDCQDGIFSIKNEDEKFIEIECILRTGSEQYKYDHIYILKLSKTNNTGSCLGESGPEFKLEKTNDNVEFQEIIDGEYSYEDKLEKYDQIAWIKIKVSGSSWKRVIYYDYSTPNPLYHHTSVDEGIVKGNDLYLSSKVIRIGYGSRCFLITSVDGKSVTLRKN